MQLMTSTNLSKLPVKFRESEAVVEINEISSCGRKSTRFDLEFVSATFPLFFITHILLIILKFISMSYFRSCACYLHSNSFCMNVSHSYLLFYASMLFVNIVFLGWKCHESVTRQHWKGNLESEIWYWNVNFQFARHGAFESSLRRN